jgi:SEC-C motif-containing protein
MPAMQPATTLPDHAPCPCGRAQSARNPAVRTYAECCGRWHAGPQRLQAPDAEALMRSRYSAYVLGLVDYLLATWHPHTRPVTLALDEPGLRWLGLAVKRQVRVDETHATVEFVARSKQGGRAHRLHETSRFEFSTAAGEPARWLYVDGTLDGGSHAG